MQDPSPYFAASFLFPEWAALDPLKEATADVTLLNAGIRSRSEIIAARGRDIDDVDAGNRAGHVHATRRTGTITAAGGSKCCM